MKVDWTGVRGRAAVHAALAEPARLAVVEQLALGDRAPGELSEALGIPSNLLAHHLRVLAGAGVVARSRSEADRRRTYLRLLPAALAGLVPAGAVPAGMAGAARVVFVCTHNSARSQLAAALWARRSRVAVASAGTRPAPRVHRGAAAVARRHGLALDGARTAHVRDVARPDDLMIAVCDRAYEELTGRPDRLHWSIPDPVATGSREAFEQAFQDIEARVERLAQALVPPPRASNPDTSNPGTGAVPEARTQDGRTR
jgi:protein-tyrosine-phosphatase/DNA-binding transcriptional ArsR family regulator